MKSKSCKIRVVTGPIDSVKYLYVAMLAFVLAFFILNSFKSGVNMKDRMSESKGRIYSLDCYRGFSVFWMVFFNYGSGGYKFIQHADWHGLTPAGR